MKHKYKAKRTEINGIKFASKKEAKRYTDLLLMQSAGEISDLQRQVRFELNPGGTFSYKYVCDFQYKDKKGNLIIEDSKGYETREFKKKEKLMMQVHKIYITKT